MMSSMFSAITSVSFGVSAMASCAIGASVTSAPARSANFNVLSMSFSLNTQSHIMTLPFGCRGAARRITYPFDKLGKMRSIGPWFRPG